MSELSKRLANAKGNLSIDHISDEAARHGFPISRGVVAKYVAGDHGPKPPEATLQGLAAGLHLDARELRELSNRPAGEPEPWSPPAVAASLTRDQRKALDALIVAIVKGATWTGIHPRPEDEVHAGGDTSPVVVLVTPEPGEPDSAARLEPSTSDQRSTTAVPRRGRR